MMCRFCQSPMPRSPSLFRCTSCKQWNWPFVKGDEKEVLSLADAELPQIERYDVGMFNEIFGGGLAHTSVNLIAGPPGAGKTTLFLMVCDLIMEQAPGPTLYIANEQSRSELRMYAQRIGVNHLNRLLVLDAMGGLRRPLGLIFHEIKPRLIILDSLTKMIGEDNVYQGVRFVEQFKEFTVASKTPTLIVNQVTKSGDHAGINKVLHAGDALFNLEKDDTTGQRLLYSTKNRFGEAPVELPLRMLSEGAQHPGRFVLWEEPETAETNG